MCSQSVVLVLHVSVALLCRIFLGSGSLDVLLITTLALHVRLSKALLTGNEKEERGELHVTYSNAERCIRCPRDLGPTFAGILLFGFINYQFRLTKLSSNPYSARYATHLLCCFATTSIVVFLESALANKPVDCEIPTLAAFPHWQRSRR